MSIKIGNEEFTERNNNDLSVHVYRGIGELTAAAGQTLTVSPRNCPEFPLELAFDYEEFVFVN